MHDYSITKDDVCKLEYRVAEDHFFLDQAFLNFIDVISNYPNDPEIQKTDDRLNLANYLVRAGYRITKNKG